MRCFIILPVVIALLASCTAPPALHKGVQPKAVQAIRSGDELIGPSVLNDADRFVWGASVVKGYDNKYHMLFSTWGCGDSFPPFTDSWLLHSTIAYAVSDQPDRNFKFQKIVLQGRAWQGDSTAWDAQMVHNPHIQKFEGKYYLYYIGSRDPGMQPPGTPGATVSQRDRVQQKQCIGVITFNNFEELVNGVFTRMDTPLLAPRTRVKKDYVIEPSPPGTVALPDNMIVVNPSVVRRPADGKYLLYFKGNLYDPHWRGVHGLAIADAPAGPFIPTQQYVFDVRNPDGTIASGEDPYVWYHYKSKKFYAVLKDFTGRITKDKPGLALLESIDGVRWDKPVQSFFMKKQVVLASGDTIAMNRLERPQLLLDKRGNPRVLYVACSIVDVNYRTDGTSFNVHIPLR